jgi:hypothetical protein
MFPITLERLELFLNGRNLASLPTSAPMFLKSPDSEDSKFQQYRRLLHIGGHGQVKL